MLQAYNTKEISIYITHLVIVKTVSSALTIYAIYIGEFHGIIDMTNIEYWSFGLITPSYEYPNWL